jgi:hypothetical protein
MNDYLCPFKSRGLIRQYLDSKYSSEVTFDPMYFNQM